MTLPDIILLGHGSRRGSDTDEGLKDAVTRSQARVGPATRVRVAGFEFTRPSIPEAVAALVEEGSRNIMVLPFFLFDGKHVTEEIPEQLDELRAQFPDLELTYGRTLGVDLRMVELVTERVHQALFGGLCDPPACSCFDAVSQLGVIFVNRGSHFKYDDGERLRELARLLNLRLGAGATVAPAQAEYESPTIPEAADMLAGAGATRIVAMPYIFFPGKVLNVNIVPAIEAARGRHPQVEFLVAPTLGVDDRVIDLAVERAHEAAALSTGATI